MRQDLIQQLREQRAHGMARLRDIDAAARAADRVLTAAEEREWEALSGEIRSLNAKLEGAPPPGRPGPGARMLGGGDLEQPHAPVLAEFRAQGWELGQPCSIPFRDYRGRGNAGGRVHRRYRDHDAGHGARCRPARR